MYALIDRDGKRLRNCVKRIIERHGSRNVFIRSSQDIICEMVDNIKKSYNVRKMVEKYAKADVLITQNCEDFKGREFAFNEFMYFCEEIKAKGVKIVLTFEEAVANSLCNTIVYTK